MRGVWFVVALTVALAGCRGESQMASVTLSWPSEVVLMALDVSADGRIVVGQVDETGQSDNFRRALLWTPDGRVQDLGTLGGPRATATGISADGRVVVGGADRSPMRTTDGWTTETHAFRWTASGGMKDLGTLGGDYSWAEAVSPDGKVVVGKSITSFGKLHAFRWTERGGMEDLGVPPGAYASRARDVSADGRVVVGYASYFRPGGGPVERAFRWTEWGGMEDLGTLGGENSRAYGVSADGRVVVGEAQNAEGQYRAFRWTPERGMEELGTPGGRWSRARDVSADGQVVVGWGLDAQGQIRAFRWSEERGWEVLPTLGGRYAVAVAVSADGKIVVGLSEDAEGRVRAVRWNAEGEIEDLGPAGLS